jgi:hypothetical protein
MLSHTNSDITKPIQKLKDLDAALTMLATNMDELKSFHKRLLESDLGSSK